MHYKEPEKLTQVSYRVPRWMRDKIVEVQRLNRMQTETEAVRYVVIRGLEAMGIDLPPVKEGTA